MGGPLPAASSSPRSSGSASASPRSPDPFLGGFRPEATLIPLIEATLALGMSLWLVDWFRRRANLASTLVHRLGRASFGAYLVHAPITILLAIALRDIGVQAELKFLIVAGLGTAASSGFGLLTGRSRVGGRIL